MSEKVIYKITNRINDKIYIGSTQDKKRRWREHKSNLKDNHHRNQHLQNSWNKYGSEEFEFLVIEDVQDKGDLLSREEFYLRYINYHDPESLYNIALDAKAPMRGRKRPAEVKKKIGEGNKGKERSREHKRKISENHADMSGKNNPFFGKTHSRDAREKIRKANEGENSHNYGKEFSREHRRKIGESQRGEKGPGAKLTKKQVKIILHLLEGNSFIYKEIGAMFGVSRSTIGAIAMGDNWEHVSI